LESTREGWAIADFIAFNAGKSELANNGLPATCYFALSTKSVDGTNAWVASATMATASIEITGTGYARQSESEPTAASGVVTFAAKTFSTGSATDWSSTVRSVFLTTGSTAGGTTGVLICAWNLVTSGVARDMSQANTSEVITPTLTLS
jgi:hypothetical protein